MIVASKLREIFRKSRGISAFGMALHESRVRTEPMRSKKALRNRRWNPWAEAIAGTSVAVGVLVPPLSYATGTIELDVERLGPMPEIAWKYYPVRRQLPQRPAGHIAAQPRSTPDGHGCERRNLSSRKALLWRISVEYQDMPGLRLTLGQAQRLFGLREDICVRVFNALVQARTLCLNANGAYARNACEPKASPPAHRSGEPW